MKRDKTSYIIQTVAQALAVMEQFREDVHELGSLELGRRLKLKPVRVARLLATLRSRGYLEQNPATEGYRLGLKSHQLGQAFVKQMGLLRQARPVQESLVRMCRETSCVSIMKDFQIVCLDAVESDLPVRVAPRIGIKSPLHCTGAGKVLAANLSEDDLRTYLLGRELMKFTPNTIVDHDEFAGQLRRTAYLGYAVDHEESELGVTCIGAPLRDRTGAIVGAVSVSGPSVRMVAQRLHDELIPLVKDAAHVISLRLGWC
jgi:DNA-binding IclR family transcriptional regulator